jgi:hypothetical protein
VIPTPVWLAQLLNRRAPAVPAELKPDPEPEPTRPSAAEEPVPARLGYIQPPPDPIRVVTSPRTEPPQQPARTWLTATFTEADEAREAAVLTRLADRTHHLDDPWAAALGMNWEGQ